MHWLFHTWPRKALFFHARYLAILGRYLPASQVMVRQILVPMLAHGTLCISGVSRSVPLWSTWSTSTVTPSSWSDWGNMGLPVEGLPNGVQVGYLPVKGAN